MAVFQAILAFITRSLGRILNTAFGWATALLFGKVPAERQIYLSLIAFLSVLWLIAALGIAFPSFATFLFAFVTLPDWMDAAHVRIAMLIAAAILPTFVGAISYVALEPADRPESALGKIKLVLRGYPYAFGLALTVLLMIVFAPILKIRHLAKRWTSQHVPIMVEAKDYLAVVDDAQRALETGGLKLQRQQASLLLRLPTKILTFFARGGDVQRLVADELTVLVSPELEVLLHPADLVISGRALQASRAHAVLTEHLTFTRAYLTWNKDAHEIEDRLRAIWEDVKRSPGPPMSEEALERLKNVERVLKGIELPYEEWEVLFRAKLLVERTILRTACGIEGGGGIDRNAIQGLGRAARDAA